MNAGMVLMSGAMLGILALVLRSLYRRLKISYSTFSL